MTALCLLVGFLNTGSVECNAERGSGSTPFDLRGIDADGGGSVVLPQQLLGDHPAERVADQDRLAIHAIEQLPVVRGDVFDPHVGHRIGVGARGLDGLTVTRPAGSRRVVAALGEVLDPGIPGRGMEPKTMDENNRGGGSGHTSR